MSTSGGYTQPANPCPTNVFTRAALLALRTAGTLRPECHYLVTGPVIGTAGNTSPTVVEMHATSPTELSMNASLRTNFYVDSWNCEFDIDLGAAGSIQRLTDNWDNEAIDSDPDAPTVHAQVPWHKGGNDFRDNVFQDATLPGWGAAGGTLTDNDIQESMVDLTGKTLGTFNRNVIHASQFTANPSQSFLANNIITAAVVSHLGGGSFSYQGNTMNSGQVNIDAASVVTVTMNNNTFGGASGGYRVAVVGKTSGSVSVTGNKLFNVGSAAQDLLATGTGPVFVQSCDITRGDIAFDGSGTGRIDDSVLSGSVIDKAAGSTTPLTMAGAQFTNTALYIAATNGAVDNVVTNGVFRGGVIDLRGPVAAPGRNDFIGSTILDILLTVAATATAGLRLDNGLYNQGVINQNRTAGTASTILNDCTTLGLACVIEDNGTTDPGQAVALNRVSLRDSLVTVGSIAAGRASTSVVSQMDMTDSLLFVSALPGVSEVRAGRMLSANITTAFELRTFTLDGMIKTLTAAQSNRQGDPSFDNFV